jgi:endoglucanase
MRRPRTRSLKAIVVASAMAVGLLGLSAVAAAPPVAQAAAASCSAAYSVQTDWGSGFTAAITVTDNGTSAITGWTLTYSYTGNQTLQSGWNGNWTQSGKTVTITNESYNGSLAAGANTSLGANFNYSGTNTAPTSVTCTPTGGGSSGGGGSITASTSSLSVNQSSTGTFTLALSSAPSSNETVSIAASGNTGLTESPASLTFTPSNFATAQTVTVTANSSGTGTTTFTASGSGYTSAVVTVTENAVTTGTPSIKVTPTSQNITQGSTGTVGISLSSAPSSNVTVSIAASGNTGLTDSPTSLTFTPSNFATAQNVTITANSSGTGATTFTASASGLTSVTFTATEVASSGGGAAPQLHVSGNKLLDQNGNQVVLHGVDRSGTEYECVQGNGIFDGPNDQASITAMKSWGPVNAVRVPLNEACWNAESYVNSAYAGTNYINAIKAYVSLLNSNGIVAILDLHWTDGLYTGNSSGCSSAEATCQKPMPDSAEAIPFWTSVANTFKGNNAVIFDLFNEPYASRATGSTTTGWQCWENGGTCSGISYQVAGMQQMVNAVRSTGANNVLMLGGEEYANDLTDWLQYEPTDPDHNLVASFHSYNFNTCSSQSCWTSEVAPVIASVPVIAGEIGENDCAGGYIDSLTNWLESENTSFLAWAWNADFACSSGPGLITDYTGTPTSYGAAYKAILQALPGG